MINKIKTSKSGIEHLEKRW